MSFFRFPKNVEVTRGKIWAARRILKYFPVKSLKLIPHHVCNMGTGVIMHKNDSDRQQSRAFWIYDASQHPQSSRNEPRLSVLLSLPPFPMLDEHTLHYAHFQSNQEKVCGPVHFHYACLLPYIWQYRYVTTVLPAFSSNVFYRGCSVFIWLSLKVYLITIGVVVGFYDTF